MSDPGSIAATLKSGSFSGDDLAAPAAGAVAAYLRAAWTKLPPKDREASFSAVIAALLALYASPAFAGWQQPVRSEPLLRALLRPLFVEASNTAYLAPRHPGAPKPAPPPPDDGLIDFGPGTEPAPWKLAPRPGYVPPPPASTPSGPTVETPTSISPDGSAYKGPPPLDPSIAPSAIDPLTPPDPSAPDATIPGDAPPDLSAYTTATQISDAPAPDATIPDTTATTEIPAAVPPRRIWGFVVAGVVGVALAVAGFFGLRSEQPKDGRPS